MLQCPHRYTSPKQRVSLHHYALSKLSRDWRHSAICFRVVIYARMRLGECRVEKLSVVNHSQRHKHEWCSGVAVRLRCIGPVATKGYNEYLDGLWLSLCVGMAAK